MYLHNDCACFFTAITIQSFIGANFLFWEGVCFGQSNYLLTPPPNTLEYPNTPQVYLLFLPAVLVKSKNMALVVDTGYTCLVPVLGSKDFTTDMPRKAI